MLLLFNGYGFRLLESRETDLQSPNFLAKDVNGCLLPKVSSLADGERFNRPIADEICQRKRMGNKDRLI